MYKPQEKMLFNLHLGTGKQEMGWRFGMASFYLSPLADRSKEAL